MNIIIVQLADELLCSVYDIKTFMNMILKLKLHFMKVENQVTSPKSQAAKTRQIIHTFFFVGFYLFEDEKSNSLSYMPKAQIESRTFFD